KTVDNLDHVTATRNEYTVRAIPWSLVLSSGMAAGYMELADDYAMGARMNRANALAFRRKVSEFNALAARLSVQFAESLGKLEQVKDELIPLAFGRPKGSAAQPALLTRVANGIMLDAADAETAQALAIERGVLMTACGAAGAPNDIAKGEELLKRAVALVPR